MKEFKPIGTVPSSRVLTTSRDTKMLSIMSESQLLIPVDMDKEEVGNLFENYNLNSAAVVDKNNKLVGMIMSDDVLTVLKKKLKKML
jgi:magnesium transporter